MTGSPPRTAPAENLYRAAWARLKPALWGVAGFSAIINVLMLTGSVYMLQVYDRVLSSGSVPTLIGLFTIVVVLFAFLGVYDFLRSRMLARVAVQMDQALAGPVHQAWLRSGVAGGADKEASPQPMRDLEAVRGFTGSSAMSGLFDLPFVPMFLCVLFIIHPWIGWLTVAGSVLVLALTLANKINTEGQVQKAQAQETAASDFAMAGQRGAEAVVAMGMMPAVSAKWQGLHRAALATGQGHSDPGEALTAFSKAFRMLLQSAILTMGALLVLRGEISAGMIIAASVLSGRALAPVDQAVGQLRSIQKTAAAHKRLTQFFADLPAAAEPMDLPPPSGQITLAGVTKFAPGGGGIDRRRLLTQVSFALEPGDGLGVIGNSASGKSSLARVLVGAWKPEMGEVRLNGATPDQWDPSVLGRHMGYMPQSLVLLPGTIRDNIARFDAQASDKDVMAAAKMAGVHDMILALPDGYNSPVAEAGAPTLSGGQIQRLGLARAIYGKPSIVVLDEPNANLDTAGDEALSRTIRALREAGTTVIVMAHRPSALAAVNKVLMLRDGTVAEFGPKEEVLSKVLGQGQKPRGPRAGTPGPTPAQATPADPLLRAPGKAPAPQPPGQGPRQAPRQGPVQPQATMASLPAAVRRSPPQAPRPGSTRPQDLQAQEDRIDPASTHNLRKLLAAERAALRSGASHPFFTRNKTGTRS